jgi:hypothetical protein
MALNTKTEIIYSFFAFFNVEQNYIQYVENKLNQLIKYYLVKISKNLTFVYL